MIFQIITIYGIILFIYTIVRWNKIGRENEMYVVEEKGMFKGDYSWTWWRIYLLVIPFWFM